MDKKMAKSLALRAIKLLHLLTTVVLFCLCLVFYYNPALDLGNHIGHALAGSVLYLVLIALLGRVYGIYNVGSSRISQLVYSQSLTMLIAVGISYVVMVLISLKFLNPLPFVGLFAAQVIWSILWSYVANLLYYKVSPPRPTVVIYGDETELRKLDEIRYFDKKFKVTEYICESEGEERLAEALRESQAVFVLGIDGELRTRLFKECVVLGVQCYIMPRVCDVIMAGADHMTTFSVPFMRVQRACPNLEYLFVKRAFDIFASLIAIVLASPFMLVTALAIKLYDRGPVLYKQVRLTKDYREFNVLKFRSMRTDAEKDGVARLAAENDDRITPIGKIIRKIRFDELPQLFNILRGDMTIVGPRPERPEIAAQYEKEIPSFGLRLQVKAGLTGYAQVYGRYNTEPYEKLKMDLIYINNMSFGEDLRLMFATVKILFLPESTEGVADGQITAAHSDKSMENAEIEELKNLIGKR